MRRTCSQVFSHILPMKHCLELTIRGRWIPYLQGLHRELDQISLPSSSSTHECIFCPTNMLQGFNYDITLARADLATNKNERYNLKVYGLSSTATPLITPIFSTPVFQSFPPLQLNRAFIRNARAQRLQLYESHSTPKLYACYSKYSAPKKQATPEMLAPIGSSFDLAYGNFKQFFLLKTLKQWDLRVGRQNMGPEAFLYFPPRGGETQGVMPNGEVHAWESKVVGNDDASVSSALKVMGWALTVNCLRVSSI